MDIKTIADYTEADFLEFVKKLFDVQSTTEDEDIDNIFEFKKISEHPAGSDLIYYPIEGREDTPEGVVKEVKEWRAAAGKPGFKKP